MNIMKQFIIFFITAFTCVFLFSACNNSSTPKDTALTWLNGFNHQNFNDAIKVSTKDTKNVLLMFEKFTDVVNDSIRKASQNIKVTIKDVKENGDKADVTYTVSTKPEREEVLHLIKKDGKWLVQFFKLDLINVIKNTDKTQDTK